MEAFDYRKACKYFHWKPPTPTTYLLLLSLAHISRVLKNFELDKEIIMGVLLGLSFCLNFKKF